MTDQPNYVNAWLRQADARKAAARTAHLAQIAHDLREIAKDVSYSGGNVKVGRRLDKAADRVDAALALIEGSDDE
jgi:hypothetical protein